MVAREKTHWWCTSPISTETLAGNSIDKRSSLVPSTIRQGLTRGTYVITLNATVTDRHAETGFGVIGNLSEE